MTADPVDPPASRELRAVTRTRLLSRLAAFLQTTCPVWDNQKKEYILTTSESKPDPDLVVRVDAEGWGAFTCQPGGLQVWVRADAEASVGVGAGADV